MKRTTFLTLLISVFAANVIYAQSSPAENLSSKIDSLVAMQHSPGQPGGVIAVISADEVIFKKGYGLMDMEQNLPVSPNTLFDIASVAKQFTAFAILMLEDEGKLNLDDDIRKHIPQLPEYPHTITIRNLLQHTSGIASTDVLRLFAGLSMSETWTYQDEMDLIMQYPKLNFEPGAQHVYSNAGYSLLARIVEEKSGMSFSDFLAQKVFSPLGMKSTLVIDRPGLNPQNLAKGYKMENDSFEIFSSTEDFSYGSSNIISNANDMIHWGQNILNTQTGPDDYLQKISNPYNVLENGDSLFYTYGFWVRNHKGVKMVEHSGGVQGFRSQFMIFPEENIILILMFNSEEIMTRRLALGIVETMFADNITEEVVKPREAIHLNPEVLQPFEGSFRMSDGMQLSFTLEQDTFWLVLPGDEKFPLFAESETKFFLKAFDAQCSFVKGTDGAVNEMIWHQGGGDYTAIRAEETVPLTPEEIALFAGQYYQEDLKFEYPLTLEDETLILHLPQTFKTNLGFDSARLSHINGDRFLTDRLGMLEFTRGEEGKINGFVLLDVGRLQNVVFTKQ